MKSVQTLSYFWSVFSRIRTEYGPEITLYLDTFQVVYATYIVSCQKNQNLQLFGWFFFIKIWIPNTNQPSQTILNAHTPWSTIVESEGNFWMKFASIVISIPQGSIILGFAYENDELSISEKSSIKSVHMSNFSDPYFNALSLNTVIYRIRTLFTDCFRSFKTRDCFQPV